MPRSGAIGASCALLFLARPLLGLRSGPVPRCTVVVAEPIGQLSRLSVGFSRPAMCGRGMFVGSKAAFSGGLRSLPGSVQIVWAGHVASRDPRQRVRQFAQPAIQLVYPPPALLEPVIMTTHV